MSAALQSATAAGHSALSEPTRARLHADRHRVRLHEFLAASARDRDRKERPADEPRRHCWRLTPEAPLRGDQETKLGHDCIVAAPSLIPKKPGDRVKTNRRDAVGLAKLSRAGDLTAVWVPDERHEAMRDLSRAREAARKDLKGKRQQVSSFMLRLGRHFPGKKTWGRPT